MAGIVAAAGGALAWPFIVYRDIKPSNVPLAVVPAHVAAPEAPYLPPPAVVVASTSIPPARPTQTRIARPAPTPRQPSVAPRSTPYASLIAPYFPVATLPIALSIIGDMCDQERAIMQDLAPYSGLEGTSPGIDEYIGSSMDAMIDLGKDTRKQLSGLPGSTFDHKAWRVLNESDEFNVSCRPASEKL